MKIVLKKISRNGKEVNLQNTEIKFEMNMKKNGVISEFKSEVEVNDNELLDLKYEQEKGVTRVKEKTGSSIVNTTRQGLVIEKVVTTSSGLRFEY
jgi:hypothetical protein